MKKNLSVVVVLAALVLISCHTSHYGYNDDYATDTASMNNLDEVTATSEYRASHTIVNDLVHTKLDVKLDWQKQYLFGKAWLTLTPHFYPTDSLTLDAQGFDLHEVDLVTKQGNTPLKYSYDSTQITIHLGKNYSRTDTFTVYIDYTAKPNELKVQGSAVITDAKGLYFINPDGSDPSKPREMWTQGETESNSAWFPTIDKPNMKTTLELSLTVEKNYVTLSNGTMTSSVDNGDGTHTDTWKLDEPFAPYLVMMATGPFAVVKDHWRDREVNYYVDSAYEKYARDIFGHTPLMIEFFSNILGVDFAWPKYSQLVAHDFVSGAMENVTATVHMEGLQKTKREMIDDDYEDYISHELFHQWFGDLVTTESWSNISLNESFATYGEYLWREHEYGKDEADHIGQDDLESYLSQASSDDEPLIRFEYSNREDVFDGISYAKGGRILNMLRNYVGDEAFFTSLKLYLTQNRFGTGEVHKLRLAFEQVTGEDLNWFFNEWYLSKGHPDLDITYWYDETTKTETVAIGQNQDISNGVPIFKIPMAVDVYADGSVKRYHIEMSQVYEQFTFPCNHQPDLVNVDADKVLVCTKEDHKTDTAFLFQLKHAPLYVDRLEAIKDFEVQDTGSGLLGDATLAGLNDKFWAIRKETLEGTDFYYLEDNAAVKNKITQLISSDPSSKVRAAAIDALDTWEDSSIVTILEKQIRSDSSIAVITSALQTMASYNGDATVRAAEFLQSDPERTIQYWVAGVYAYLGGADKANFVLASVKNATGDVSDKAGLVESLMQYVQRFYDHEEITSQAMPLIYDAATSYEPWYMRLTVMNAADELLKNLNNEKDNLEDELKQINGTNDTYNDAHNKLTKLNALITSMSAQLDSIKHAEKDEQLISIYNQD